MVQVNYQVELRSASVVTLDLAQCAMIIGMSWMLKSLADSGLGMMLKVGFYSNIQQTCPPMYVANVSVAAIPVRNAYFGAGDNGLTILLDDVACSGNETSLESCQSISGRNSTINCSHSEDAGVHCNGECQIWLFQLDSSYKYNPRITS